MLDKTLNFDYGMFKFKSNNYEIEPNLESPITVGSFQLKNEPTLNDLNNKIYIYNLFEKNYLKFISEKGFDQLYCLGPYFPYNQWIKKGKSAHNWPNFSSILLNTKTGKLLKGKNSENSEKIKEHNWAHFLKKSRYLLSGTIMSVPAKPSYSFNSIEYISDELSKVLKLEKKEGLVRISDDEKKFEIKKGYEGSIPSEVILVDDFFTNGATKKIICKLLKNKGATKIYILCLCKTDYNFYYT